MKDRVWQRLRYFPKKVLYFLRDAPEFLVKEIHKAGFWFWLRFLLFAAVFGLGVLSLSLGGVELSQRPGPYNLGTTLYYTLGLFTVGGLALGVPQGGELWAQCFLWGGFFIAPLITISALIEAVGFFGRINLWLLGLGDHIVIGGYGRLAQAFLDRARDQDEQGKHTVVVVERHSANPDLRVLRQTSAARVLIGDVSNESVLEKLRLERAKAVFLLTGDDQANLDAALLTQQLREKTGKPARRIQIWAHVSNLSLLRRLDSSEFVNDPIVTFNGYRVAARKLVEGTLIEHFDETTELNTVVLAGFGRFGQTILNELRERARDKFETVIIIDRDAEHLCAVYEQEVGFEEKVEILEADTREPETWATVDKKIAFPGPPPIFVLACGPDKINIQTALKLIDVAPQAKIFARSFRSSPFTEMIQRNVHFEIFSPGDLLRECEDHQLRAKT